RDLEQCSGLVVRIPPFTRLVPSCRAGWRDHRVPVATRLVDLHVVHPGERFAQGFEIVGLSGEPPQVHQPEERLRLYPIDLLAPVGRRTEGPAGEETSAFGVAAVA